MPTSNQRPIIFLAEVFWMNQHALPAAPSDAAPAFTLEALCMSLSCFHVFCRVFSGYKALVNKQMSLRVKDIVSTMLQMRTVSHAALQRTEFITLCPVDIKCLRTNERSSWNTFSQLLHFFAGNYDPMFIVTFTAPLPSPVVSCHCHLLQQCTFLLLKQAPFFQCASA